MLSSVVDAAVLLKAKIRCKRVESEPSNAFHRAFGDIIYHTMPMSLQSRLHPA